MDPLVSAYIARTSQWQEEIIALRSILLECDLAEGWKWSKPTYSNKGKNIVVIQGFKQYFALLFFKGYLLKDPFSILIKTGENTVVGRQIRFKNVQEIVLQEKNIKAYIAEAILAEQIEIKNKPVKKAFDLPEELVDIFEEIPLFEKAFKSLTPGRQKAYIIHFSSPKQSTTKTSRIRKNIDKIIGGRGILD